VLIRDLEPIEVVAVEVEAAKFKYEHGDKCNFWVGEGDQFLWMWTSWPSGHAYTSTWHNSLQCILAFISDLMPLTYITCSNGGRIFVPSRQLLSKSRYRTMFNCWQVYIYKISFPYNCLVMIHLSAAARHELTILISLQNMCGRTRF
jgi:hypothetical protein